MTTIITTSGYTGPTDGLKALEDYELLPQRGLLALYEMTEGAGAVANDSKGSGVTRPGAIAGSVAWKSATISGKSVVQGLTFSSGTGRIETPITSPLPGVGCTWIVALKIATIDQPGLFNAVATSLSSVEGGVDGIAGAYYSTNDLQAYASAYVEGNLVTVPENASTIGTDGAIHLYMLSWAGGDTFEVQHLEKGISGFVVAPGYGSGIANLCFGFNPAAPAMRGFNGDIYYAIAYDRPLSGVPSPTNPTGPSERAKVLMWGRTELAKRGLIF